jgi:hypothetical protein
MSDQPNTSANQSAEIVPVSAEALREVLDYLWDEELEDYEATGQPDNHVFVSLQQLHQSLGQDRLRAALSSQPPPQLPEYKCPHCGSDNVQYFEDREHRYVWNTVGCLPPGPDDDGPTPVLEDNGTCEDIRDIDSWFYCHDCCERWGAEYVHLKDIPQEQRQG